MNIQSFVNRIKAATAAKERRVGFTDFEKWSAAAKAQGCRIRKVSKSKTSEYYQAILNGTIVGFINTNPTGQGPLGALSIFAKSVEAGVKVTAIAAIPRFGEQLSEGGRQVYLSADKSRWLPWDDPDIGFWSLQKAAQLHDQMDFGTFLCKDEQGMGGMGGPGSRGWMITTFK